MFTAAAQRSRIESPRDPYDCVFSIVDAPVPTRSGVRAQIDARRWQRIGRAVVSHNGPLTQREWWRVALINCGPLAVLTSFTAAEAQGLKGWQRPEVHVLVPGGVHVSRPPGLRMHVHYTTTRTGTASANRRRLDGVAPALLRAAAHLDPRPACGILAAAVQQRIIAAPDLIAELARRPSQKRRRLLLAACHDIAQGSQALSEIDFIRLCRRHKLPIPRQQAVRVEPSGRVRYLDAIWDRPDGRQVGAEVDGALHLAPARWYADQMRQNELVISGMTVLRFPSVVVRVEEHRVVDQLRRALRIV